MLVILVIFFYLQQLQQHCNQLQFMLSGVIVSTGFPFLTINTWLVNCISKSMLSHLLDISTNHSKKPSTESMDETNLMLVG